MFVQAQTHSKNIDTVSKGKSRWTGGIPKIYILSTESGTKSLNINLSGTSTIGSGKRGGIPKSHETFAWIYLDKEAVLECISVAIKDGFIAAEEVFSNDMQKLLEAAVRLEERRRSLV
jgi:hypothetical protein